MKKKYFFAYALIVIGASALVGAGNASAIGVPAIPVTDTLSIISEDGTFNQSVSLDSDSPYTDLVADREGTSTCEEPYYSALQGALAGASSLTVAQAKNTTHGGHTIENNQLFVYFSFENSSGQHASVGNLTGASDVDYLDSYLHANDYVNMWAYLSYQTGYGIRLICGQIGGSGFSNPMSMAYVQAGSYFDFD